MLPRMRFQRLSIIPGLATCGRVRAGVAGAMLDATAGGAARVPGVAVQAFPAKVRFSGLSFSYNLAYAIFGGLTPVVVTLLLPLDSMAPAHYVAGMSVLGVLAGIYLWRRDNAALSGT